VDSRIDPGEGVDTHQLHHGRGVGRVRESGTADRDQNHGERVCGVPENEHHDT
jgi:hypothetical protein